MLRAVLYLALAGIVAAGPLSSEDFAVDSARCGQLGGSWQEHFCVITEGSGSALVQFSKRVHTADVWDESNALVQPLTGLVAVPEYTGNFPATLEFLDLSLSQVYRDGQFEWSVFESRLESIVNKKRQAVVRFWTDWPTRRSGVPTDILSGMTGITEYSSHANTVSVIPDYSHPEFQTLLLNFAPAFSDAYDNDPRVAYLHIGLIGFYGEWSVHPERETSQSFPNFDFQVSLLQSFSDSFRRLRWTAPVRLLQKTTTSRRLLPTLSAMNHGIEFDNVPENAVDVILRHVSITGNLERWKTSPMLALMHPLSLNEMFRTVSMSEIENPHKSLLQEVEDQDGFSVWNDYATQIHLSAVFASRWFECADDDSEEALAVEACSNDELVAARHASEALGYTFLIDAVAFVGDVLTVQIRNSGVAPIYYPTYVSLLCVGFMGNGPIAGQLDLQKILPGEMVVENLEIPNGLSAEELGACELRVISQSVLENTPIKLANMGTDFTTGALSFGLTKDFDPDQASALNIVETCTNKILSTFGSVCDLRPNLAAHNGDATIWWLEAQDCLRTARAEAISMRMPECVGVSWEAITTALQELGSQ
eukprot:Clim_evm35s221 gene=Clim_evmTU35s221